MNLDDFLQLFGTLTSSIVLVSVFLSFSFSFIYLTTIFLATIIALKGTVTAPNATNRARDESLTVATSPRHPSLRMDVTETAGRGGVETSTIRVSCLQSPLSLFSLIFLSRFAGLVWFVAVAVANTLENRFYILRFDRDYFPKIEGAESLAMKVSRARRHLKLLKCQRK